MITTIAVGLVILGSIAVLAKIAVNKFNEIKETQMAINEDLVELNAKVDEVVAYVASLPESGAVDELTALLEAERASAAELKIAEDAEDVEQNAALDEAIASHDDAVAALDAKLAEVAEAEAKVAEVKGKVEGILPVVEPEPAQEG